MTMRDVPFASGGAGRDDTFPMAADVAIDIGEIVVTNSSGFAQAASTATGLNAAGIAMESVSNIARSPTVPPDALEPMIAAGTDGARSIRVRHGCAVGLLNSSTDPVTESGLLQACYLVDSGTVAATDGGGTRSKAGKVVRLDPANSLRAEPAYVYVELGAA